MSWRGGDGVPAIWADGGPEFHAGTAQDVRVVVAAMTPEVKDGPDYDMVPWERFHHAFGPGSDVPGSLTRIRCGTAREADRELEALWDMVCHQGTPSAAGALALPFLIRIALTRPHPRLLLLVAALARRPHLQDGTRTGLLRTATPAGSLVFEPSGYVGSWSAEAARQALTADVGLLLPLLDHTAPTVRTAVAHALAAVSAPARDRIAAALHARLDAEDDPVTRASLVLAIGELAWEERDAATTARLRAWWQDPARPAEVRMGAVLAWLCLVDDPVPADLDTFLDAEATDRLVTLLGPVPWLRDLAETDGLRTALTQMRNPDDYAWIADLY
ncbi:HEAT repeat domain-containing protein [Kitasatospora sp. NPDC048365]|uniref:HEAT repeat domain-containing protein n=1 Tax=Kitasatospora sp. NPDC048365 TaxID=3364050 RepID=UPI0037201371